MKHCKLRGALALLVAAVTLVTACVTYIAPAVATQSADGIVTVTPYQTTSRYDVGLDAENVRIGWKIDASTRGYYQSAYRVVVAEAETGVTAWDSGWVESSTQTGIRPEDLKPETIYSYTVNVKDQNGVESGWSDAATLETAPTQLDSTWLRSAGLLRETFTLDQPLANVKRARCYMSSSGIIEVRLNGSKVGDLIWNPKKAVSDLVTYYNTYDITDMLQDGANTVGAYTGLEANGGYALNGMLRIYYKDGSVQTVATGEGWTTCGESEITRINLAQGEDIDLRRKTAWDTPDFIEDGKWTAATSRTDLQSKDGELTIPDNAGTFKTYEAFSGDYTIELTVTVNQTVAGFMFGVTDNEASPCMWQVADGCLRIHYPAWTRIETPATSVRNGTKITMTIEVRGDTVTTYVDGNAVHTATVPASQTNGGLGIRSAPNEVATYDRLVVTQNGNVIWEDNFDTADTDKWTFPGVPVPKPAISGTVIIDEYKPATVTEITKNGKTSYVLDYGQNMQGFVRLDTQGTAGVSYFIEYSELLEDDGDIRPVTTAHCPTSTYTLSGGNDTFQPRFFYTGFRYIKVTPSDGSVIDPNRFTACFASDDLEQTGYFESSNERLNTVFRLYLMSQRSNLMGNYTDCPQREKNGWLGDASVTKEAAAMVLGDYSTAEAFLETMLMDIKPDGRPQVVVPVFSTGESGAQDDITWASAYFVFPYELYMATGDTYYIERSYQDLLRVFEYAKSYDTNGDYIVDYNVYGDWLGYDNASGFMNREFLSASYFWYCGSLLSEMMAVIGADHSELDAYLDNVYNAIQDKFFRIDSYYAVRNQTCNAMALDFGLVPESGVANVVETIVSASERKNRTLRTGVLGTKSLYDALSAENQHKLLMDMTLTPDKCSFGYMIDNGATTLWEFWDVAGETFHSNLEGQPVGFWDSQNHVMFGGGPATWMFQGLGGIRATSAGYKTITYRPGIESELTYADTRIETLVGTTASRWSYENGLLTLDIEVPANTTATVILPVGNAEIIAESGVNIFQKSVRDITYEGQDENGDYVYTVGSGSYHFEAGPLSAVNVTETPETDTSTPNTEPVTDTTTEPVTQPIADDDASAADGDATTSALAGTNPPTTDTPPAEKKGCGSSLGLGIASVLAAAAAAVALRKHKS